MKDVLLEAREDRGGLVFDWRLRKGRPFWLVFFVVVSVLGHAACFYLFQVVYPAQKRELLRPVEVVVLDPRDGLTREVLDRIEDRMIAIDSRITLDVPGEEPRTRVGFRPSFAGYEPALRDLPPPEAGAGALFVPGKIYLPPLPEQMTEPASVTDQPPAEFKPVLALSWSGPERKLQQGFQWAPAEPIARPENTDYALFRIGIDHHGRVIHALPDHSTGLEIDTLLHAGLRGMRFAPSAGGGIETAWAWGEFRW